MMTEVPAVNVETGRHVRRLTEFGLQREKEVEEQKAKLAKAALRKIEGSNGTAGKEGGGRGQKKSSCLCFTNFLGLHLSASVIICLFIHTLTSDLCFDNFYHVPISLLLHVQLHT
jgi:hypothetical protein